MSSLRPSLHALTPVLVVPAALLAWQLGVWAFGVAPDKLPAPSAILTLIWHDRIPFLSAVGTTLAEAVLGLLLGTAIGVVSGILMSRSQLFERMLLPYFVASQAVPIIAFGAIIIMWFGNGLMSKVVIAVYLSFFPVVVNTLAGIKQVDPGEIGLLRSFGAGAPTVLFKLQLPTALPSIFTAVRLGAGLALVGAIVGEWFGATQGLGVVLLTAMYDYRIVHLWAGILLTGLAGTLMFGVVMLAQRNFAWWHVEH